MISSTYPAAKQRFQFQDKHNENFDKLNQLRETAQVLTVSSSCFSTFLFFLLFSFLLFFFESDATTSVSCEEEEETSNVKLCGAVQARSIAFSTIFKLRSSLASSSSLLTTIGDLVGFNCWCSWSSSSWWDLAAFGFFSLLPIGDREEEEGCRSDGGEEETPVRKVNRFKP